MQKDKVKIQTSKDFKGLNKEKLLEEQNEIRASYGLRPLKRLRLETFLTLNKHNETKPEINIPITDGGMYQ